MIERPCRDMAYHVRVSDTNQTPYLYKDAQSLMHATQLYSRLN